MSNLVGYGMSHLSHSTWVEDIYKLGCDFKVKKDVLSGIIEEVKNSEIKESIYTSMNDLRYEKARKLVIKAVNW